MKRPAVLLTLLIVVLLSACSEKTSSNISIKPYTLSEEEQNLISKTGVDAILFFKLDGKLAEEEDLQFAMEIYKDGVLTEDQVYIKGQVEKEFNEDLISFGFNRQENELFFLNGMVNGLLENLHDVEGIDSASFTSFINDERKLAKDEAVYLVSWVGSKGNELEGLSINEDGSLSDDVKTADAAFVFKVMLTDYEKE
ncbi:hypothetical protein FZC79_18985 [Rossellomorea vietnamensis]|uniref:Lipoprotein n=1 Tax=Rossellomorea vietnamensis TaxID=218284 RepID=A0A5D4K8Z8_9BACI|nr:hypothetical protein [Rossellomorea vietnamensis]TYR73339.1 hypothetical protein FZC79_18985 [Rossellomorea vietnamensis]